MKRLILKVQIWFEDLQDRIDDDPILYGVLMMLACGTLAAAFVGYLIWGRPW